MSELIARYKTRRHRSRAILIATFAAMAASAAQANTTGKILVVTPGDLPELARMAGEAMLLRDTTDGKAILYVEQERGARLAVFNVTDPGHIRSEGSIELATPGAFDFRFPVGRKQELIQFREGGGDAVLEFNNGGLPKVVAIPGRTLQGAITPLGDDGFIVAGQEGEMTLGRYDQIVDISKATDFHIVDVKNVHAEIAKADTGTTFLLAEDGLYIVRQPDVESAKLRRDQEWVLEHSGN